MFKCKRYKAKSNIYIYIYIIYTYHHLTLDKHPGTYHYHHVPRAKSKKDSRTLYLYKIYYPSVLPLRLWLLFIFPNSNFLFGVFQNTIELILSPSTHGTWRMAH
jgi:hypothetical protein